MERYPAIAIQSNVKMVDIAQSEREIKRTERENLDRVCELIGWAGREAGKGVKLIVLPESFLHAFPRGTNPKLTDLIPMALRMPGEELEILGQAAREANAYICGAAYEYMEDWPGRVWNTAFILNNKGELILKHHKTKSESGSDPARTLHAYVERYGEEALFKVVDTELGKLGAFICAEGLFRTEVARCLAMNGAEVLCYPISTTTSDYDDYFHVSARAHAYFNQCYLVGANLAHTISKERPLATGGGSLIINYQGRVLTMARTTEETTIRNTIDLAALREYRASHSFLLDFNAELYAPYRRDYRHPDLRRDLEPSERFGDEWASYGIGKGKERADMNRSYLVEQGILVEP